MRTQYATPAKHTPPTLDTHRAPRGHVAGLPGAKHAGLLSALTVIAHDLRGPLANLAVLIELIETYAQMHSVDGVRTSTRKAQEMIEALDGLLNGFLRRVRETGDPLAFKPTFIDLAEVMEAAIDLNRPIAESRNIAFNTRGVRPLTLSGDKALLTQAVGNLVSNAVKYAPPGSTVTPAVAEVGREAIISISDEGMGLTEHDLKRAFRPFATLSTGYRSKDSSWGLGLWVVRLIAERHGGHVDVTASGPRTGARFEISLPILNF